MGSMVKGIFDFASKKIVADRINKKKSKNSGNSNQSILDELKPTKKTGYYKGKKCYWVKKHYDFQLILVFQIIYWARMKE